MKRKSLNLLYINVFIEHRTWFVFAQELWFFANIISRVSVFDDREKKSSHPIWWCVPKLLTMCGWNFKWSHPSLRTLTRHNRVKGVMNTLLNFLQTFHKVHFELKLSYTWRTEIITKMALQKNPKSKVFWKNRPIWKNYLWTKNKILINWWLVM